MVNKEYFEVLLEDINSKFDLLVEGHAGLSKQIEDLRWEMKEFRRENDFAHRENEAAHRKMFQEIKKLHKQDEKQEKVTVDLKQRVSRLEAARI